MIGKNKTLHSNWPRTRYLSALVGVATFSVAAYSLLDRGTFAGSPAIAPVAPVANPCPRPFTPGSVVQNPPALFSSGGVLNVAFSYQTRKDTDGTDLFCFMTPYGLQDPTLHVKPGDTLNITVTNNTPAQPLTMTLDPPNCGDTQMGNSSLNMHFHGTNTSPACHGDQVIKTVINSGETFQYNLPFPNNEPSGLYWYHPHIHGIAEHAVQGGASGAIVVDGIENIQPAVSGLRQRILMVRDQPVPGNPTPGGNIPSWDVTLNYVTITSPSPTNPNFVPAKLNMAPGEKQFWRISNSSSDTILDLQYVFDGVAQTMQVVAIDGVPVNSQDGTGTGGLIPVTDFVLPPASRVEVIVSAPPSTVQLAQLITLGINTGPGGDNDPQRPLATIQLGSPDTIASTDNRVGSFTKLSTTQRRFGGLGTAPVAATRTVFFDETPEFPQTPTQFFMAVQGQKEKVFDPNAKPAITATQGTVEEWTVENHTFENHEFHFHQLHFLVESQNFDVSQQAPADTGQYLDMIQVPFWQGPGYPFPSVTLRLDFRGPDIGDFVFHCHILGHEDLGMMNIIRVKPADE
jgi:FtsP/CotA-like multicopper oxidase with cupredoxin domain